MKKLIVGTIIGLVAFPTIAFGGNFVSSLIQGKSVEEATQIIGDQLDLLIGRVKVVEDKTNQIEIKTNEVENKTADIEVKANKETACRKVNELKVAPAETKIMNYTEEGHQPITSSWAPSTTKELLEYFRGYMKNYEETGGYAYLHNPDYMPDLVQKYIPILEARQQQIIVQEGICNQ